MNFNWKGSRGRGSLHRPSQHRLYDTLQYNLHTLVFLLQTRVFFFIQQKKKRGFRSGRVFTRFGSWISKIRFHDVDFEEDWTDDTNWTIGDHEGNRDFDEVRGGTG